jgi:multimeric flavodoxin WrbA
MKIVTLLGSPRPKGNSAALARQFNAEAEKRGFKTTTHTLNALNYRGCQGCYACKTSRELCILRDDLTNVLEDVARADVLVLATPVYFGDITSQLKGFIDRTFAYFKPDYQTSSAPSRLNPGKKLVFIQTQGNPDESVFADLFSRYSGFLKRNSFEEAHLIRARGVSSPDDVENNDTYRQQVADVADKVFGPGETRSGDAAVQW